MIKNLDMNSAIQLLVDDIVADYDDFQTRCGTEEKTPHMQAMFDEFVEKFDVSFGKKYIKLINGGGVWGFVVNTEDDKKFKFGDILMAAGWSKPARNKARGNVFGEYSVRWTGPNYLRGGL